MLIDINSDGASHGVAEWERNGSRKQSTELAGFYFRYWIFGWWMCVGIFVCLFVCLLVAIACFYVQHCMEEIHTLRNDHCVYCWLIANKPALSVRVVAHWYYCILSILIDSSLRFACWVVRINHTLNGSCLSIFGNYKCHRTMCSFRSSVRLFSLNHQCSELMSALVLRIDAIVNKFLK